MGAAWQVYKGILEAWELVTLQETLGQWEVRVEE